MSDFESLMAGLTFCGFASPAPASEDALAGTGGGEHPKDNSSPLYKFGECGKLPLGAEAAGGVATEPTINTSPLSNEHSPIYSGMTIERLISAVVVCEERAR